MSIVLIVKSISQRDRFLFYTLKSRQFTDKNLNGSDKKLLIDGDVNDLNQHLELLESYIEFLNNCKYFTSNIQFGISNKIKLMNL